MGQPEHSPSDQIIPPRSLAERLKAEANGDSPPLGESTATSMAQRFAPDIEAVSSQDFAFNGPPDEPLQGLSIAQTSAAASRRGAWASRALLGILILVSLIPTATVGVLFWPGVFRASGLSNAFVRGHDREPSEAQQASTANSPALSVQPKQDVEGPSVALTAPNTIAAEAGKEVPFSITLDSANPLPLRSIITISGLPQGSTLSNGRPYGEADWTLRPDEIGDLRLLLPKAASGQADLRIELVAADGTVIASAVTQLAVAPDHRAALILRPEDSALIADLMAHGQKMVEVGYLAGARAYFKRAAEAGSADAAIALGATYDPHFIEDHGIQGIKADPEEARKWYERGEALRPDGAAPKPGQPNSAGPAATQPAQAGPAPTKQLASAEETSADQQSNAASAVADTSAQGNDGALQAGKEEWVELSGAANMRASPSSTAQTIRVAQKGDKLRAIGRKGGWTHVTDPATTETGWISSHFVASAPAQ
jgi:Bacterial SH3 domain